MIFSRHSMIAGAAALTGTGCVPLNQGSDGSIVAKLRKLEGKFGGRQGVVFLAPAERAEIAYRGGERFPLASTFTASLAAFALSLEQEGKLDLSQQVT